MFGGERQSRLSCSNRSWRCNQLRLFRRYDSRTGCTISVDRESAVSYIYNPSSSLVLTLYGIIHVLCPLFFSQAKMWIDRPENFELIKFQFDETSRFARLQTVTVKPMARCLYIRFTATTGDAMGMNMISKVCTWNERRVSSHWFESRKTPAKIPISYVRRFRVTSFWKTGKRQVIWEDLEKSGRSQGIQKKKKITGSRSGSKSCGRPVTFLNVAHNFRHFFKIP